MDSDPCARAAERKEKAGRRISPQRVRPGPGSAEQAPLGPLRQIGRPGRWQRRGLRHREGVGRCGQGACSAQQAKGTAMVASSTVGGVQPCV